MLRALGPTGWKAALLALLAGLTAVVTALLFLRDVTRLEPHFAALAWRTATVAALSIAVATGALALLFTALADRSRNAEDALAEARREREARRAEL